MKDEPAKVLILIVMDNGLSPGTYTTLHDALDVLILIVMDNGLSQALRAGIDALKGLNPYCNG